MYVGTVTIGCIHAISIERVLCEVGTCCIRDVEHHTWLAVAAVGRIRHLVGRHVMSTGPARNEVEVIGRGGLAGSADARGHEPCRAARHLLNTGLRHPRGRDNRQVMSADSARSEVEVRHA